MNASALAVETVALYLRRTPFVRGRWRLVRACLPMLRRIGGGMGERIVRTRHGFRLRVDLAEWIGQHIYLTGDYERPTARLIQALARQGSTVIDVGANIGFFTLLASRSVGRAGRVLAFEPVASTCTALRTNVTLDGAVNIAVHELALSNANGTAEIHEGPGRNKGLSSLRPLDETSGSRTVATAVFDDLGLADQPISLVKIDVEGAEQLVLEGMLRTLAKHRPHLIVEITERFLAAFGHSATSLCELLAPLGYRASEIIEEGIAALPADPASWPRQFNALFSPASG